MSMVNTLGKLSVVASLSLFPSLLLADQNSTVELSEVTVTGEKIDRSLHETTTAITVVKGDSIDSSETRSAYDVASQVPNMINNPSDIPVIRGVTGIGAATGGMALMSGARPRVSTSVDGISEGWSGQRYMDIGTWDIEQVEVLRGPQSTTQGRNSIGGAVVINTKDPTFESEGAVRFGYENNDDKATLATMISGPIVDDELAMRLSAQGTKGHGYINYQGSNTFDPSDIKQGNIRAKLLWVPKDIEGLIAKVTVSHRQYEGEYLNLVNGKDFYAYNYKTSSSANARYGDATSDTVSTEVEYAINDDIKLYVLVGHSENETKFKQSPTALTMDLDEKSNTVETRVVYDPKGGLVSSMVGLYYYNRTQDLVVKPDSYTGDDEINTAALFSENTLHVTDALDFIVGGRVERESQERNVLIKPSNPTKGRVLTDEAETLFLPKAGIVYTFNPDHNIGFTVRKGYSPGGGAVDTTTTPASYYEYDKEEVTTYEMSTRSLFLDKSLAFNTNLFYNEYDGYQALSSANRFTNIDEGESYGFEAELRYQASEMLEVFSGIGLLHTEVTKNGAYVGNEFNYAPHFTGNVGFKQRFSSGIFFGSDLTYVGEYYSDIDNTELYKAGKYVLVNMNLGYETKHYTIRTYVKNAFDEEAVYFVSNKNGGSANVVQPRTFGVTFDYRF